MVPIEQFGSIRSIPPAALSCLCIFGTLFLILQSKGLRLRKICAFQTGMVAMACILTIFFVLLAPRTSTEKPILSPFALVYGNTYAFIFLLYPLELMHPGWVNVRRTVLLFLPAVILGVIYFAVIHVQKITISEIHHWHELADHFGKFDVWFRLTIFIYPIWLFAQTLHYKIAYNKWCEENCSSKENKTLGLLNDYNSGFFLLLTSYITLMMVNSSQCRMLHCLVFIAFMGYLLYQNFFNITPIVEQMQLPFYTGQSEEKEQDNLSGNEEAEKEGTETGIRSFTDKMPQYKEMLEEWMHRDKPYQNPNFKLLDCMSVLPLNRSYLSRLFNEGYNETFFAFVMRHRIDESVRLFAAHPDLTSTSISEMCGFSSPAVFGRAFLKHMGITPLQYRRQYIGKTQK